MQASKQAFIDKGHYITLQYASMRSGRWRANGVEIKI